MQVGRQIHSICIRDIDAIQAHKWRNLAIKINDPILQDDVTFKCISVQIRIKQPSQVYIPNISTCTQTPTNSKSLPWSQDHRRANKIQHWSSEIILNSTHLVCGWLDPNTEIKPRSPEYFQPLWNTTISGMT